MTRKATEKVAASLVVCEQTDGTTPTTTLSMYSAVTKEASKA